jgi:tricarballylate dehydrogenase
MVGGIFYFNYPGGSGLTNGAVFGRIAGRNAGESALRAGRSSESGSVDRDLREVAIES